MRSTIKAKSGETTPTYPCHVCGTLTSVNVLGIDPVLAAPKPAPSADYKTVVRNGVVQDDNNNWVYAWVERDMFADTTEDGVTTTKAEHESAYQAKLDAEAAKNVRTQRDSKLAETDFYALSDVTMSVPR